MATKPRRKRQEQRYRRENLTEESRRQALRAAALVVLLAALVGVATFWRPRAAVEATPETTVTSETSPDPASPPVAEAPTEAAPGPALAETAEPGTPSPGPNTVMAPTSSDEIERRNREAVANRPVEVPVPVPTPRVTYGVRQPAWPEPVYGGPVTTTPAPTYRVRSRPGAASAPTMPGPPTYGSRGGVTHHSYGTTRSSGHYRSGGTVRYSTRTVTVRRR